MELGSHVQTVVQEGGGRFSVICSCGWSAGASYESEMGAGMAYTMLHKFGALVAEGTPDD